MDKVKLDVKKGEAVIKEGGDSFVGKLMAKAGTVRIHRPGVRREVKIVQPTKAARSLTRVAEKK